MFDTSDDCSVDVLVIGAGAQGRYVANALAPRYSVCVLADPAVGSSALDTPGLVSAGYTGNDAVRMQAARRTAGYWRHLAEVAGAPGASTPTYVAVPNVEAASATHLWDEAGLEHRRDHLPGVFDEGRLVGAFTTFRVADDVVVDPGALVRSVTSSTVSYIDGTVVKFGLDADSVIDHVDVDTGHGVISIAPRFVVLAAGVNNAAVLASIARRFRDQSRRRLAGQAARQSQVVVDHHVVALRSAQLPVLAGTFDDLTVVAHQVPSSPDVVWLVTGCPALHRVLPGDAETRFDPPVDQRHVAQIIGRLRAASTVIDAKIRDVAWSAYVARDAVHPSGVESEGGTTVGTPIPARLDSFGLESFLALWPSHLGYTMLLGDVVAERVATALGNSTGPIDLRMVGVARTEAPAARSRWWSPTFLWHDWDTFAAIHGLPPR